MDSRPHPKPSQHYPVRVQRCRFRPPCLARAPASVRAGVNQGSLWAIVLGSFVALLAILGLVRGGSAEGGREIFTDVTEQAGITFRHFNGESPDRHLIETKNG